MKARDWATSQDPEVLARAEGRFAAWQRKNPDGDHGDYYAEVIAGRIGEGRAHGSLAPDQSQLDEWLVFGREKQQFLIERGLLPEHVVVDFGCGSLRLGIHLMEYLHYGHYWGLDVTRTFIDIGMDLIGADRIAERAPHLYSIDAGSHRAGPAAGTRRG